jgi:hypothetical protein
MSAVQHFVLRKSILLAYRLLARLIDLRESIVLAPKLERVTLPLRDKNFSNWRRYEPVSAACYPSIGCIGSKYGIGALPRDQRRRGGCSGFARPRLRGRRSMPGVQSVPSTAMNSRRQLEKPRRDIRLSLFTTRIGKLKPNGLVRRKKASFFTGRSTCHLACAPSLKRITSPAP